VYVQANEMANAVHVKAAVFTRLDHPVHRSLQQLVIQHALHQHPQGGVGRYV
jgi:hypothetical protein